MSMFGQEQCLLHIPNRTVYCFWLITTHLLVNKCMQSFNVISLQSWRVWVAWNHSSEHHFLLGILVEKSPEAQTRFQLFEYKGEKIEMNFLGVPCHQRQEPQYCMSTKLNIAFRSRKTEFLDFPVCLCSKISYKLKFWSIQPRPDRKRNLFPRFSFFCVH